MARVRYANYSIAGMAHENGGPIHVSLEAIFSQYEERLLRLRRNPETIAGFRRAARVVLSAFHGRSFNEIEPWEWEELWAGLPLKGSTKRQYLTNVRAAIHYAQRRGTIQSDPTHLIEIEREAETEPRILTSHDLRWIKSRCHRADHYLMFHLFAYTGMRWKEVHGLKWDNVNLKSNTIMAHGKGGKIRYIPIHPALGELLPRAYHLGQRVTTCATYETLDRIAPGIGGFHAFRRTFATSLAINNVPERVIDRIMGWAPRTIGRRYYINVADAELQEAILKIYKDDPI